MFMKLFFLVFFSLMTIEAKAQSLRGTTRVETDLCRFLNVLEVNANLNYQILPQTFLPIYLDQKIYSCGDYTQKKALPLNFPFHQNSFFLPHLFHGENSFIHKM